jgi:O-antigen/teichoic acid export membrane protein
MNKIRRVVNNTLISLFGQVVTWSSTLLLTIAYGRYLGDIKFGELFLAITFVSLVGIPVEQGFNQQLTRDVAENPEKAQEYLWNTLLIKAMLWVPLYGAILFFSWLLGYDQEQRVIIAICGITLMSGSTVSTFAALHYAFERTLFPAVGMILEKGLTALVGTILLINGATVQVMAFVLLGGSIIDAIWVAVWFFRLEGWRVSINKVIARKLLRGCIPFILYGVLGIIYYRIDTILLSLMASAAVVGWYGAGYRLFDTLFFIPSIIVNAVMYPVFSKLSASSPSTLKVAVEKCMNLLLMCALPIATLFAIAAPNIVGFLYHRAEFTNTIPVIQALAPGLVIIYANALFFSIIVATRGEKKIPIMAGAALVFNLGLNLFLIPRYQQVGAALVTSLTELLLLCISLVFVPRNLLPAGSIKVGGKVLLATILMGLAAFLLRSQSIFIIGSVALVIYIAVATLLGTIPREDVQTLLNAFRSKGRKSSSEMLANVVDENMYTQITQQLPVVRATRARPEAITELLPVVRTRRARVEPEAVPEDEDATELLLVVKETRARPEARVEPEVVLEDEGATELLPVVKAKRARPEARVEPEVVLEDEDATELLPVVKAERARPEARVEPKGVT